MAVETQNSSSSTSSSNVSQPDESPSRIEEQIEHHYTHCPNCQVQVILLPRTIQTFCYRCGEPVTRPDKSNMYYE